MGAEKLLICNCGGTMDPDAEALGRAAGCPAEGGFTELCGREAHRLAALLEGTEAVTIACAQEEAAFVEIAEEAGFTGHLATVDIRDRAGWSAEGAAAGPKQAALLAAARVPVQPTPALTQTSHGTALLIGPAALAFEAAALLGDRLGLTCLLTDPDDDHLPPLRREIALIRGRIARAHGWLGAFRVEIEGFAEVLPSARGALGFGPVQGAMQSDCDLILDFSGGAPLFPASPLRDGYLRADPADRAAVMEAFLTATALVGDFEKPLYVSLDAELCAHQRSGKQGCQRCLSLCPTSAIQPAGDAVRIEANICAGCGACAAACPSSAITYRFPGDGALIRRLAAMQRAWREAGGGAARLLIHDPAGLETIAASARFGRGLPADMLPIEVYKLAETGHALVLAALSMGFEEITLLATEGALGDHRDALDGQLALAHALAGAAGLEPERVRLVEGSDPDLLEADLYARALPVRRLEPMHPIGRSREIARQVVTGIAGQTGASGAVPLSHDMIPGGVPYGSLEFNAEACTLCLACVSQCPSGALLDNPEKPQLAFIEEACLQCGICTATCPESALKLDPRFAIGPEVSRPRVLKEEDPFACVECGKLFGTRSTVERISEKLAGKHWMFSDDSRIRMIQMCDDCRVAAQFRSKDNPFTLGDRPRVRTTDDYLAEEASAKPKPPKLN